MGMVQSKQEGDSVYQVGCLGKISDFQKSKDGRILINLTGISRFKILEEITNDKLYREFKVDYKNFSIAETNYDMVAATILDKSPKELFQKALESRNDIMLAKTNVEIAQTNLKTAKSAYQPTLTGYYGYSSRISYGDRLITTGTYSEYPMACSAECVELSH